MRADPYAAVVEVLQHRHADWPEYTADLVFEVIEKAGWRVCGLVDEVHFKVDEIWGEL